MRTLLSFSSVVLLSLSFSACSHKSAFMEQDKLQAEGKYIKASNNAKKEIDYEDKTARDNLLWYLYLGQSQFFENNESASISSFDEAENLMKTYREQILAKDAVRDFTSILSNDNTRPYIGNEYDGIMLNTYKALSYLQKNDYSGARVELNRAVDRQRRAKEFFADSIAKEKDALEKNDQDKVDTSKADDKTKDKQLNKTINTYYPELNSYKVYPDFVNPMTNYLAALFALANDDKPKAQYLLKETMSMLPNNTVVQEDYENLINATNDEASVWVIYEEGLAPVLDEMRIDFPAWIFTSQVDYVSIALPKMRQRAGAFSHLDIRDKDYLITQTQLLSSMQRVMHTEFKKKYPQIMQRAALSAISKAALQNVSKNSGSNLVNFAATVYSIVSTQADTRIWTSLPKHFHVARFDKKDRTSIDIFSSVNDTYNYKIATVDLLDAKHTLIYVKIPTLAHKVNISIFSLGEN